MEMKLISFDIKAALGFLKKPDINEGIYLTYNCLHKPALLGIIGAIIGLGGYYQSYIMKKYIPDYFERLKNLKVGVKPLDSFNGNFTKTVVKYNNSAGYASEEQGGNLIVNEQTLIKPSFRVYLLLNISNEYEMKVFEYLSNGECEYIPYFGKNDFQLWWEKETLIEYDFTEGIPPQVSYFIDNLFIKPDGKTIHENKGREDMVFDFREPEINDFFVFFEHLPVGFDERTTNYSFANFVYTNKKLSKSFIPQNLYYLKNENKYVQLN
ncbi:MAG: type I-B CRISPR-associated protein Cas5 [Ignavibacteriae bacterium]|nr:MAG: type I-B CRISPR-associated protein Cas5 [Ignavibacteriota bacterium]